MSLLLLNNTASMAALSRSTNTINKAGDPVDQPRNPRLTVAGMDYESNPDNSNFMSDGSLTESSEDGETEVDKAQPSNAKVFISC